LRGTVGEQVLCPFGGPRNGERNATEADKRAIFDAFDKAWDKLHGGKTQEHAGAAKAEAEAAAAPAAKEAEKPAAAAAAMPQLQFATVGTKDSLNAMMAEGRGDFIVVFYAPWCPHCQAFVLADDAPVDRLAKELHEAGGPKVVVFDTTKEKVPDRFEKVHAIPTIRFVSMDGRRKEFMESPETHFDDLKAWALKF